MKPTLTLVFAIFSLSPTWGDTGPSKDVDLLWELLEKHEVRPLEPKPEASEEKLELGQALFFDPVLGGTGTFHVRPVTTRSPQPQTDAPARWEHEPT